MLKVFSISPGYEKWWKVGVLWAFKWADSFLGWRSMNIRSTN